MRKQARARATLNTSYDRRTNTPTSDESGHAEPEATPEPTLEPEPAPEEPSAPEQTP